MALKKPFKCGSSFSIAVKNSNGYSTFSNYETYEKDSCEGIFLFLFNELFIKLIIIEELKEDDEKSYFTLIAISSLAMFILSIIILLATFYLHNKRKNSRKHIIHNFQMNIKSKFNKPVREDKKILVEELNKY